MFVLVNSILAAASCTLGKGQINPSATSGAGGAGGAAPDAGADALPDALLALPDAAWAPTTGVEGLPGPQAGVYTDLGPAPPAGGVRGLVGFPIRDRASLEALVQSLYDPTSASFRSYLDPATFLASYAPAADDVELVTLWLEQSGLAVPRVAANRLLLELTGTVEQFNQAFGTTLHLLSRKDPQQGGASYQVYGALTGITVPAFVAARIAGVLTADLPPPWARCRRTRRSWSTGPGASPPASRRRRSPGRTAWRRSTAWATTARACASGW